MAKNVHVPRIMQKAEHSFMELKLLPAAALRLVEKRDCYREVVPIIELKWIC